MLQRSLMGATAASVRWRATTLCFGSYSPLTWTSLWAFIDLQTRPKVVGNSMNTSKAFHNSILAKITHHFHAHQMDLVSQQTGLGLASNICITRSPFSKRIMEVEAPSKYEEPKIKEYK